MRFRMAQTAKGPLESHSHIPPRNATLYGESPSYSATSGDPKPKTYCRCKQDRPIMSDGCVSTAVRRPHFFFEASHEGRGLSRLPDRTREGCGKDATKIGLCRTSRLLPAAELPSRFPLPPSFHRFHLLMFICSSRLP